MRIKPLMLLLPIALVAMSFLAAAAQSGPVKAKFEIENKDSKNKFRIVLYADGIAHEPTVFDDGHFYVPTLAVEKVDVQLISGKYNLMYKDIYLKKLRGTLTFRVKEHLSPEDSHCKPGQKLVSSYSLEFDPGDADGTAVTVEVCKENDAQRYMKGHPSGGNLELI